jgi:alkylation response protein AidB-like acyl-CoA dehydrogenase
VLRRGRPGSDREYRLSGTVEFVVHGSACDRLLVAARAPGSVGGQGISVVLVDPHAQGVGIYDPVTIDVTRRMSRITFHDVPVSEQCVLGEAEAAGEGLERALQYARIALAAEAVGAAEWTLEMTTAYARQRVQFGRPIGSFQVIKHRLADMMIRIEAAQSAAWYAACVADELEAELDEAAAIAKACCCDAFYRCAADAIQLHGGIGFTWEHDAHLYFKRARATATLLGSPAWHRERLAQLMGLGRTCTVPTY